jgi:3-hydroxyacyl-CoA dehydrogenase
MTDTTDTAQYVTDALRAANVIDDVPAETPLLPIKSVGVIGAGTMGGGIAMNFANVGIPVHIVETKQDALDRGLKVIRTNYERSASRGRFSMEEPDHRGGL